MCVQFVEIFHCPLFHKLGNGNAAQILVNLCLKLLLCDAFLLAFGAQALGTVIIDVVKENRIDHFFNRCLALWAGNSVPRGKLKAAISTDDLIFLFRGHHAVASAATDETSEGKVDMLLRSRASVAVKQFLHAVELRFRHHGFVFAIVPLAASFWKFESAVIEWFREHLI